MYVGLMWGEDGPQVVEFNVRFGDPECQIMSVADTRDWAKAMLACARGEKLGLQDVDLSPTVGVVLADLGYPYEKPASPAGRIPADLFPAGVFGASLSESSDGSLQAQGGRVLTVVGTGLDFGAARRQAYGQVKEIVAKYLPRAVYRDDIAERVESE